MRPLAASLLLFALGLLAGSPAIAQEQSYAGNPQQSTMADSSMLAPTDSTLAGYAPPVDTSAQEMLNLQRRATIAAESAAHDAHDTRKHTAVIMWIFVVGIGIIVLGGLISVISSTSR